VRLVPLQALQLLVELVTVIVQTVLLLLHTLGILALQLRNHLRVSLLRIGLVIEVHLLLQLKRLLELLLQFFKIGLRLVALGLQELEATLP